MYKFTILDEDVQNLFNLIQKNLPKIEENILKESSYRLTLLAKIRAAPEGSGTGRMASGIRGVISRGPFGSVRAEIMAGDDTWRPSKGKHGGPFNYAVAQEEGFRPHIIHKNMWMGPKWTPKGEFTTVKRFTPFMGPALEDYLRFGLDSVIEKELNKVI